MSAKAFNLCRVDTRKKKITTGIVLKPVGDKMRLAAIVSLYGQTIYLQDAAWVR